MKKKVLSSFYGFPTRVSLRHPTPHSLSLKREEMSLVQIPKVLVSVSEVTSLQRQ